MSTRALKFLNSRKSLKNKNEINIYIVLKEKTFKS